MVKHYNVRRSIAQANAYKNSRNKYSKNNKAMYVAGKRNAAKVVARFMRAAVKTIKSKRRRYKRVHNMSPKKKAARRRF